jgi:hypothetical protein
VTGPSGQRQVETATRAGGAVAAGRWATARLATILGALLLVLGVGAIPLAHYAGQLGSSFGSFPIVVVFGAVGVVVALRLPHNPIGWTLIGVAATFVLSIDGGLYAELVYRTHHGSLPFGAVAVLLQPGWAPAIVLMGLAILLFPDGNLPSSRWRWGVWGYLVVGATWWAGALVVTARAILRHAVQVDSTGNLVALDHPSGDAAWWGVLQDVFFPLLALSWLVWLVGQIPRYRRSTGIRRLQLKWLISGALFTAVGFAMTITFSSSSSTAGQIVSDVGGVGLVALPICMGVAILKYRLYDIDRLISRTLSYAAVTGLLLAVYVGMVALTTRALALSSSVGVAAATLAAAALFAPLRRRVQRTVDRRFNRTRYDAEATVAAFILQLRDAVDLDAVRSDLVEVVNQTVQATQVSVWVKPWVIA